MEKQIEGMRELIHEEIKKAVDSGLITWTEFAQYLTERLAEQGYSKQIVEKWKAGNESGQYGYYCTNCKAGFTGENAEWIAKEHDFCPKCGAKMKED